MCQTTERLRAASGVGGHSWQSETRCMRLRPAAPAPSGHHQRQWRALAQRHTCLQLPPGSWWHHQLAPDLAVVDVVGALVQTGLAVVRVGAAAASASAARRFLRCLQNTLLMCVGVVHQKQQQKKKEQEKEEQETTSCLSLRQLSVYCLFLKSRVLASLSLHDLPA